MSRTIRTEDPYWFSIFADSQPAWKATRDKKPWYKPPSWYKRMKRQQRRAQDRNALQRILRTGEGEIPIHKKTDMWNWT